VSVSASQGTKRLGISEYRYGPLGGVGEVGGPVSVDAAQLCKTGKADCQERVAESSLGDIHSFSTGSVEQQKRPYAQPVGSLKGVTSAIA